MNKFEDSRHFKEESKENQEKIPIPVYNPDDQFTIDQLKQEYSDWHNHYGGDPELTAINYERTRALRKLGRETGTGGRLESGGEGLKWAIDHTPKEVGINYNAHGIAGKHDAISELDQLLREGIKKDRTLYSMSFIYSPDAAGAFGADRPITKGGFIVVAERNEKLQNDGIKYVVVGEEYSRVLDILRGRYPHITFVPWHEAPALFTEETNKAQSTNISYEKLTEENRPYYNIPKKK